MIKLEITSSISRFKNKCITNKIPLKIIKEDHKSLTIITSSKYLKQPIKDNYYSNINIIGYTGIDLFIKTLKKYIIDYIFLIIFIISLYLTSNIIIAIEIKHENNEIKKEVKSIIKEYKITPFTIKKDLKTLNSISDEIINKNRDLLEWISISNDGMKYIIAVEERIKTNKIKQPTSCNVISTHDAIITKIISESGTTLIEKGSNVHKGDILISSEIIQNEEVKANVCATGTVYGETWYKINILSPLTKIIKTPTKRYRYNFQYNKKYFYKKNYKNYDESTIFKYKNFRIVKQQEYTTKTIHLTYEEAKKEAINKAITSLIEKTGKNSKIISQNVLKESKKNSKIELEIFVSIEQIISERITYEVGE